LKALGLSAVAVVGAGALGTGVFYSTLPAVADAPARVRAIDARHAGRPVVLATTAKVARAVVAVEDERYFEHGGVDLLSVVRAMGAWLTSPSDPGGSTITQQLAKVLYVDDSESLSGRVHAIRVAVSLERRFTKAQILNMYLNAVYFGHGFYGVSAASRGYFGKDVGALSWGQAALLAGLPQAPTAFDPLAHQARARSSVMWFRPYSGYSREPHPMLPNQYPRQRPAIDPGRRASSAPRTPISASKRSTGRSARPCWSRRKNSPSSSGRPRKPNQVVEPLTQPL